MMFDDEDSSVSPRNENEEIASIELKPLRGLSGIKYLSTMNNSTRGMDSAEDETSNEMRKKSLQFQNIKRNTNELSPYNKKIMGQTQNLKSINSLANSYIEQPINKNTTQKFSFKAPLPYKYSSKNILRLHDFLEKKKEYLENSE